LRYEGPDAAAHFTYERRDVGEVAGVAVQAHSCCGTDDRANGREHVGVVLLIEAREAGDGVEYRGLEGEEGLGGLVYALD